VATMRGESGFGSTLKGPPTVTSRLADVEEVARFRELLQKNGFFAIPPWSEAISRERTVLTEN